MLMPDPEIVVLGHCTLDDLSREGVSARRQPGGAAIYAAIGALIWGRRVGVVSVVGHDYPVELLEELRAGGVDVRGLRRVDEPTISGGIRYAADGSREFQRLDLASIARMTPTPDAIPDEYRAARAFHLAPMSLSQQLALAQSLPRRAVTSWDIESHYLGPDDALVPELLAAVHVFCPSIANLRAYFGLPAARPDDLLVRVKALGAQRVALKLGDQGALVVEGGGEPRTVPVYPVVEIDATGAGDAFCGGLVAGLLAGEALAAAALYGAVSASFVVETAGAALAPSFTPAERDARLAFVKRRMETSYARVARGEVLR